MITKIGVIAQTGMFYHLCANQDFKEKIDDLLERKVIVSELLGSKYYLHFRLDDKTKLVAKASADKNYSINELVYLEFMKDKLCIFDPITEKNIK